MEQEDLLWIGSDRTAREFAEGMEKALNLLTFYSGRVPRGNSPEAQNIAQTRLVIIEAIEFFKANIPGVMVV